MEHVPRTVLAAPQKINLLGRKQRFGEKKNIEGIFPVSYSGSRMKCFFEFEVDCKGGF